jgi:hypothetical protein
MEDISGLMEYPDQQEHSLNNNELRLIIEFQDP